MATRKKSIRQHQLLAIEKGIKSKAKSVLDRAYHSVQKAHLFVGQARTFHPLNEDGPHFPPEHTKVQQTVDGLVKEVRVAVADELNVMLRKDVTNTEAKADLVVDGETLLKDVPVTFLLSLEKSLVDMRTFISKLPVLDTADDWKNDVNSGLFKTEPTETLKTQKQPEVIRVFEPTEHQKGVHEVVQIDVPVGSWRTVKESGALPEPKKAALLERTEQLLRATQLAREEANSIDVVDEQQAGETLMRYLFGASA